MSEESPRARDEVVRLKWYVVAATVALLTILEVFYLTVVEVPPVECLIEWVVVTGLALALIHFAFKMMLRQHDRVEQQARELAKALAEGEKDLASIRRLAYHDELTGLPNRALFKDRLEAATARARRNGTKLVVMLMDLDRFKDINDTFGHMVGDRLLRKVGERLMATLRKRDTVCRMGGDEFLLLSPDLDRSEEADAIASRVLTAIRDPFIVGESQVKITTSLGIALYPDHGLDCDALIRSADIAMYHVKDNGRDGYQWHAPSQKEGQLPGADLAAGRCEL
jgi:diguanylate cyclase (GGDEF)-like protein